jgi:hypothetical protein
MTLKQAACMGNGSVYRYGVFDELRMHAFSNN